MRADEIQDMGQHVIDDCLANFRAQKKLADRALAQLGDEDLRHAPVEKANSIAVLMKHVAGNMLSRWTDFLQSDGEKPWRKRDEEFVDDFPDRPSVEAEWERGWTRLFETVQGLESKDLQRTVTIRGEAHTVVEALHRQIAHYGYHIGQIVLLGRLIAADRWQTLSILRGASEAFNQSRGYDPARPSDAS